MSNQRVGGDIEAMCNRCKLTLEHTILAMVGTKVARVRCNTCGGDHAYRGTAASAPRAASSTPRAPRASAESKVTLSFEQLVAGKDAGAARTYSPKETFAVEQLVRHPTFGVGIVAAVRGDKVDITFKTEQRTLVHGRGDAASAAKPTFHAAAAPSTAPADKRPAEDPDAAASS